MKINAFIHRTKISWIKNFSLGISCYLPVFSRIMLSPLDFLKRPIEHQFRLKVALEKNLKSRAKKGLLTVILKARIVEKKVLTIVVSSRSYNYCRLSTN